MERGAGGWLGGGQERDLAESGIGGADIIGIQGIVSRVESALPLREHAGLLRLERPHRAVEGGGSVEAVL